MSEDTTQTSPAPETPLGNEPIVARAGGYYRNARYIMFAIIVGMGLWFMRDGLVTYPRENVQYDELTSEIDKLAAAGQQDTPDYQSKVFKRKEMKGRHSDWDIAIQRILGFSLPPVGLGLLIFWLHRSRGEIRLEDGVLTAPGCPAVPLAKVDELDKEFWDRKGIAYAYYDLGNGQTGKVRLDDFIYQAQPVRDIVTRIEDELKSQESPASTTQA